MLDDIIGWFYQYVPKDVSTIPGDVHASHSSIILPFDFIYIYYALILSLHTMHDYFDI